MKHFNIFIAVLALTFVSFFPVAVRADEGLEGLDVTMMVLDDASDLEESINEMDGPDDSDLRDDDWEGRGEDEIVVDLEDEADEESEDEADEEFEDEMEDQYEGDDFIEDEDEMDEEDDFEDGEDVDEDEFDEAEEVD
jgi:hypothetical protein